MLTLHSACRKAPQSSSQHAVPTTNQTSLSQASLAQACGLARFSTFNPSRRPASLPSESCSSSNTPAMSSASLPSPCVTPVFPDLVGLPRQPTPIPTEEEEQERDIWAVRNALYQYREEPVIPEMMEPFDLVWWWDVRTFIKSIIILLIV